MTARAAVLSPRPTVPHRYESGGDLQTDATLDLDALGSPSRGRHALTIVSAGSWVFVVVLPWA